MEEQLRLTLNVTHRPLGVTLLANATSVPTLVLVLFTALLENRTEGLVNVRWDFGDGIRSSGGLQEEHRYRRAGPYRVQCTVLDRAGAAVSAAITIVVQDRPPEVRWEGPQKLRAGLRGTFVANGSDPDGNVTRYNWSFGDGWTAAGSTVEHAYRRPGRFLVSVTAVDDMGSNASFEAWVVVEQSPTPDRSWSTWPLWLALVAGASVAGVFLLRRWNRRRDRDFEEFFSGRD